MDRPDSHQQTKNGPFVDENVDSVFSVQQSLQPEIAHCSYVHDTPPLVDKEQTHSLNTLVTFPNKLIGRENVHPILMNGAVISALIDTGSQVSIISQSMFDKYFSYVELQPLSRVINLRGITGDTLAYTGFVEIFVRLGTKLSGTNEGRHVQFFVVKDMEHLPKTHGNEFCLVGMNIIEDLWNNFTSEDLQHSMLDFVYSGLTKVAQAESKPVGSVKVSELVYLPPNSEVEVRCTLRSKLVGMRVPLHIEFQSDILDIGDVVIEGDLNPFCKLKFPVKNRSDSAVELCKGSVLGIAHISAIPFQLDEDVLLSADNEYDFTHNTESDDHFVQENHPGLQEEDDDEVTPDMQLIYDHINSLAHLTQEDRDALLAIVANNNNTFSKTDYDIGKVKGVKHSYVLTDSIPFKVRQRNLPPRMYAAARDHLNQLLDKGIIRPSISPYSSAPMFLQKPDGRVRMVTDLRYLNNKTVRDCYALPRFDDILPYFCGKKYFSKMDIRSGYYNIEVAEEDKEKTAFGTVFGLYEYNRMVQGAKTSAATFQRCMENILRPMLYEGAIAFLDDVIIYSETKEEHLRLLDRAFQLMSQAGLKLHPGKCTLMSEEIVYLGHIISKEGVSANPEKLKVLTDWKKLVTVKDVLSFLGFCGYFRRHIPHFSTIAKPLHKLCEGIKYKPKSKFGPPVKQPGLAVSVVDSWTEECQRAREQLIEALMSPPLLLFPDLDKTFIVHTDASGTGLGAVLLQYGEDKLLHPVCYASRGLKNAERNYPPYKLEFLALKWAVVDKFNFYLYGSEFKVYTDNNPLTYIHKSLKVDATTQRWLAALGEYDFSIHYKPGNTNIDADILSRLHEDDVEVSTNSVSVESLQTYDPTWIQYVDVSQLDENIIANVEVKPQFDWFKLQSEDVELQLAIELLGCSQKTKPSQYPRSYRKLFFCKDRIFQDEKGVYKKTVQIDGTDYDTIILPRDQLPSVLKMLHDESGHLGIDRICKLFRTRFYYTGYMAAIAEYIDSCPRCLVKKSPVKKQTDLGRVTASRPFETLSMDFLKLDENERGYKKVLVVTDVFTKYAFAFPTKNELATTVAKLLVDNIFNVFGIPERLLSDRGRNFEGEVIKQFCELLGIKKVFTCPYSPKSDAVCERFNRTLIGMIGTLSKQKRAEWHKHLPYLVSVYNNTQHAATNFSPFELIFGRKSRLPVDILLDTVPRDVEFGSMREYIKHLKGRLETCHSVAREHSEMQHLQNKYRYDKKLSKVQLKVGDKVLIRNVGIKGEHKLEPVWLPEVFEVTTVVGPRVYEVRSIKNAKRLKVLHLDMLKPLNELESRYHKSRKKHSHSSFDQLGNSEIQKLFDDDFCDQVTDPVLPARQSKASINNKSPLQKSRYRLRSKGPIHTLGSASDGSSDSEINSDVESMDNAQQVESAETKHASTEDSDASDTEVSPQHELIRSTLEYPENSGESYTSNGSDSEDNANLDNSNVEPAEKFDTHADSRVTPDILADECIDEGDEVMEDTTVDVEESVVTEVDQGRRTLPARTNRGAIPTRFGDYVTHYVLGGTVSPPLYNSKVLQV